MRVRNLTVLVVLVALGASACGSSSKGAASGTTTTSSPVASTPTAGGGSTDATTTTVKISGDSGSSFCDLVRGDLSAFKANNITGSTPTDLKTLYQNLSSVLSEAVSKAPSAIKPDFQTFVTAFSPLLSTLAKYNYDFSKIPPADYAGFASMGTPQVKAASNHIEQYVEQVCHVSPTSTP